MGIEATTIDLLARVREKAPLIHNITNYVVMNSSANILLAAGASPVMAHSQDEVEEMTSFSGALVLNIGTIEEEWLKSMIIAARAANAAGIPIIVDPVGSGATRLRTNAVKEIMDKSAISVLRGNCSEVLSLGSDDVKTRGVDSSMAMSGELVDAAKQMAVECDCVIAISGAVDCVTDGTDVYRVSNGQEIMTKVTGTGCGLSAVTGAFCAVADDDLAQATAAAFGYYGLCGDLAARTSDKPGSFPAAFLDCLYTVGEKEIRDNLKVAAGDQLAAN